MYTEAAIAAGAALVGTAGSAVASGKLNRKTRKWNEKMWDRQNEYNLPSAQMQRFKDAGLNPNLIYGQGTAGNAEKAQSWSPSAPDLTDLGGAVGKYFTTKLQQGQLEHQRLQNAILATDLEDKQIDLEVKNQLKHVSVPGETYIDEDGNMVMPMHFKNMHFESGYADMQRRITESDRARVAAMVEERTADARISQTTQTLLNDAARNGLIRAQEAQALSQSELNRINAIITKYEADFLQNFDLRHGDISRMLMQLIPMLLRKR